MSWPMDLATCIETYRPAGDETSHGVALQALATGRDTSARTEFDPGHFTASGFVVSPNRLSMLLIHHAKLDRWLQPGGHFEPEDLSVEDAARREITEETGISSLTRVGTTLARIDAHNIPERGSEPEHIHIDLGVGFVSNTVEIGPTTEVLDARWVPFDELAKCGLDAAGIAGGVSLLKMLGSLQ